MNEAPVSTESRLPKRGLQAAVAGALLLAYAALSHYSASRPGAAGLAAALVVGPVTLIALLLLWRWAARWLASIATIVIAVCLVRFWGFFVRNYEMADLLQQCAAYALVAASFARSLSAGRIPLSTQLARELHGDLTARELTYNRRATVAWAVFYAALSASIFILFYTVPHQTWSLYTNFATFGIIIAAALADFALRSYLLPRRTNGGLLAALQRSLLG